MSLINQNKKNFYFEKFASNFQNVLCQRSSRFSFSIGEIFEQYLDEIENPELVQNKKLLKNKKDAKINSNVVELPTLFIDINDFT